MQLTVNSGGVVYFAMFQSSSDESQEEAAVFKFGSSRLATQSERLGIEIARHLGVATPEVLKAHTFACMLMILYHSSVVNHKKCPEAISSCSTLCAS